MLMNELVELHKEELREIYPDTSDEKLQALAEKHAQLEQPEMSELLNENVIEGEIIEQEIVD